MLTLAISILPSIVIMLIVYNLDKDKEPKKLLALLFFMGIVSCIVTLNITSLIGVFFPNFNYETVSETRNLFYMFIYTFFVVGLVEEFSKWLFNISIGWNNKEFDQVYDAIVYAVFISLGFATFENVIYVMSYNLNIGILRAIISVPGHAFFGVSMGYYLGLSKLAHYNQNDSLSKKNFIKSLIVPATLHGTFDFCLLSENTILIILFVGFIIALYIYGIKKIKRFSKISESFEMKTKFCANCGKEINTAFCPACGTKSEP